MFAKLLKHEWKATWGVLGVLSLCALGAGAVGAVMLRLLIYAVEENRSEPLNWIPPTMLVFVFLGLVIYAVGSGFVLLHRFYKNKFTDQGYLTFTLPARSWQIFLASWVNILVWEVIISLVVTVAVAMILLFGMWELVQENVYLPDVVDYIVSEVDGQIVLSWLTSVTSFVFGTSVTMCCITLGAVAAKKHKLLAAVGIYYGVSMLQSTVSTSILVALVSNVQAYEDVLAITNLCNMAIRVLFGVGGFFLSTYLMDHKLNLP